MQIKFCLGKILSTHQALSVYNSNYNSTLDQDSNKDSDESSISIEQYKQNNNIKKDKETLKYCSSDAISIKLVDCIIANEIMCIKSSENGVDYKLKLEHDRPES